MVICYNCGLCCSLCLLQYFGTLWLVSACSLKLRCGILMIVIWFRYSIAIVLLRDHCGTIKILLRFYNDIPFVLEVLNAMKGSIGLKSRKVLN